MIIVTKEYQRDRAVEYARKWALSRNPLFLNFAGIGGDCTSFISQAVLAGSCTMNFTEDFGWYYIDPSDRAPAWSGVNEFYDFMTQNSSFVRENGGIGPYGTEVRRRFAQIGDVVQLADAEGDYYHSLLISDIDGDEIYVCAHTNDALDRKLSSYNYSAERFIHIEGVRDYFSDEDCFEALNNGIAIPVPENTSVKRPPDNGDMEENITEEAVPEVSEPNEVSQ